MGQPKDDGFPTSESEASVTEATVKELDLTKEEPAAGEEVNDPTL